VYTRHKDAQKLDPKLRVIIFTIDESSCKPPYYLEHSKLEILSSKTVVIPAGVFCPRAA